MREKRKRINLILIKPKQSSIVNTDLQRDEKKREELINIWVKFNVTDSNVWKENGWKRRMLLIQNDESDLQRGMKRGGRS